MSTGKPVTPARRTAVPEVGLPNGPHRAVELVWPGKCRTRAAPADLVEFERFGSAEGAHDRDVLIAGDNLAALAGLRSPDWRDTLRARGGIKFIYIDPPYAMEIDHHIEVVVGAGRAATVDAAAYSDTWGRDGSRYLQFMYQRLLAMHDVLADDGAMCVHCDWRANSWLRLLLDEVFGRDCFRNEIVWRRAPNLGRQAASRQLGRVIDTLLLYTKTPGAPFRGEAPRLSRAIATDSKGRPRGAKWDAEAECWFTTAPRGDYTDDSISRLRALGRVYESASGRVYVKYLLRRGEDGRWYKEQPVDTLWIDDGVRPLRHCTRQELDIGYATQKPEGLLRRLIEWTTRPGDLVADFFCGSGTTLAVAEKLGRRWIGCDDGSMAVHLSRKRLLALGRTGDDQHSPCFGVYSTTERAQASSDLVVEVCSRGDGPVFCIRSFSLDNTAPGRLAGHVPTSGVDWIDAWAVGVHPSKTIGRFDACWYTSRRRPGGPIQLTSDPVKHPGDSRRWMVKVFDVLGGSSSRAVER